MTRTPAATAVTEGPFDVLVEDGTVQLLDDCPHCHRAVVTPLPVGDALLGAEQLQAAAQLAEADAPMPSLRPAPAQGFSRADLRLVDAPNGGA
ncbi:hypothetical protein ABT340_39295 [Streptosporangium sp. NPDC000239]|uniref:hypothetical protein n=1 Tax=Streptosporangium sp. NPDC000239 TaxID=3154248 RepID=UPI00332B94BC